MDVLYIAAAGSADPTRASIPFHIGVNGSLVEGQEIAFVLAGDAGDLIAGDNPQTVEGIGLPPLRDLFAKVKEHSIPVYV